MSDTAEDAVPAPTAPTGPIPETFHPRMVAIAEVLLCSSVPTQLVIGALLGMAGLSLTTGNGQLSLPFVVTLSLTDTAVLIALMVLILRSHGESARALWLGSRPIGWEVLRGLALVPVVVLMVGILLNGLRLFFPSLHNVQTNPFEELAGTTAADAALLSFVAIFAGGLREELQRAFLLVRFERHLGGAAVGVVVINVVFGLLHAMQGRDAVIATGTLGLFWAILYLRRRSSVAPIVNHAGFNSMEILRIAIGP